MTESQWLKAKSGDDLLSLVHDRLSERKWTLLACGVVRRVLDLLPAKPYHDLVSLVERQTPNPDWAEILTDARMWATIAAADRQREIVKHCDPDATADQFHETEGHRINPVVPFFEAASANAATAIEYMRTSTQDADLAVRQLHTVHAGSFDQLRARVYAVKMGLAEVAVHTTLALELKVRGDEMADRNLTRQLNVLLREAEDTVGRMRDQATEKMGELPNKKTRSENLALSHLIREQLGNPFRPFRFNPKWRTETVVLLARGIEADRAFDRMPILADALLDADCDDEAILRHCRGTEPHTKEPPHHAVGCWVLDLILDRDPELFALPPLDSRTRPQGRSQRMGPFVPPPEEMM